METQTVAVARILGIADSGQHALSKMSLAFSIEAGLSVAVLDRLSNAIAPQDSGFPLTLIPRATLQRRRAQNRLSPEESALVGRIALVWAMALDVYKTEEAARRFLHEPHALLHGKRPLEVAQTNSFGADAVEDILGRLKYGSAA